MYCGFVIKWQNGHCRKHNIEHSSGTWDSDERATLRLLLFCKGDSCCPAKTLAVQKITSLHSGVDLFLPVYVNLPCHEETDIDVVTCPNHKREIQGSSQQSAP